MNLHHAPTPQTWNYVRMSTDDQEDSPITQGQLTAAFMEQNELAWTRSYFDLGESGGTIRKRPGMLALLHDAERLRPTCIVFYRLDRAFRNAEEQAVALNRFKRLNVRVLKVRDPNLDGAMGDLIDGILGNINQFERQLTGMRIRDHNQAMAERGEWTGGIPPFGYRYRPPVKVQQSKKTVVTEPGRLEPEPAEWSIARQLWEWALAGHRQSQILDMASQAGLRRRHGGAWTFSALTALLKNRFYAGYLAYGRHAAAGTGEGSAEWHVGQHPSLVTADEWHQVQVDLFRGNRRQRQGRHPRMELAGLVRCSLCGGPVASSGMTRDKGYTYTCIAAARKEARHPTWSRRDWIMHLAVRSVVTTVLAALPASPPPTDSEQQRASVSQDLTRLQRQLDRLRELYVLGEYGDDLAAYQQRKGGLETQIAALRHQLETTGPSADELRERYRALAAWQTAYIAAAATIPERQALWRSVIDQVECDGYLMTVQLRDLGPDVPRLWQVQLPPLRTRKPGTSNGLGIVGQPKTRRSTGHALRSPLQPRPLQAAARDDA